MKITDKELEDIRINRDALDRIAEELSEMNIRQILLENEMVKLKTHFISLITKDDQLISNLMDKYGEGLLDLETGEIKISNGE